MNRPTPDLVEIEAALATLAEPAPPSLAHGALVAVGLADDYALIEFAGRPAQGRLERSRGIGC